MFYGEEDAEDVCVECLQEGVRGDGEERGVGADDAGVGEEDVETTVALDRVVDDGFQRGFVAGVEAAGVDICGWV